MPCGAAGSVGVLEIPFDKLRAGFRLRKPIRLANRFTSLRMTKFKKDDKV